MRMKNPLPVFSLQTDSWHWSSLKTRLRFQSEAYFSKIRCSTKFPLPLAPTWASLDATPALPLLFLHCKEYYLPRHWPLHFQSYKKQTALHHSSTISFLSTPGMPSHLPYSRPFLLTESMLLITCPRVRPWHLIDSVAMCMEMWIVELVVSFWPVHPRSNIVIKINCGGEGNINWFIVIKPCSMEIRPTHQWWPRCPIQCSCTCPCLAHTPLTLIYLWTCPNLF